MTPKWCRQDDLTTRLTHSTLFHHWLSPLPTHCHSILHSLPHWLSLTFPIDSHLFPIQIVILRFTPNLPIRSLSLFTQVDGKWPNLPVWHFDCKDHFAYNMSPSSHFGLLLLIIFVDLENFWLLLSIHVFLVFLSSCWLSRPLVVCFRRVTGHLEVRLDSTTSLWLLLLRLSYCFWPKTIWHDTLYFIYPTFCLLCLRAEKYANFLFLGVAMKYPTSKWGIHAPMNRSAMLYGRKSVCYDLPTTFIVFLFLTHVFVRDLCWDLFTHTCVPLMPL